MSGWKYKADVSHFWYDEEMPIYTKAGLAAKELRRVLPKAMLDEDSEKYEEDIHAVILDFEEMSNNEDDEVDEFNSILSNLYFWADNGKMLWFNTH